MRRIAPVTFTCLGLALAATLSAQGWRDQERYGDGRRDGYRGEPSYPQLAHMDRVSRLAHEIHQTSAYIHQKFERNNRRPDWAERRAMLGLHELNVQAARFHDEVESYRGNPRHTIDDFRRLEQSFFLAARSLERIDRRPYVDQGMDRIFVSMNDIARYYGRARGYGRWGAFDGDSWRYDDRDRYAEPRRDGGGRGRGGSWDGPDGNDEHPPR
jgi:hypothetical protein